MVRTELSRVAARRSRQRVLGVIPAVAALLVVAGCGLFSEATSDSADDGAAAVEKARIKIAVIPSTDMAPLWVADQKGYFTDEGLDVEIVTLGGGNEVMPNLLEGTVDFAFASYPLLVRAQQQGKGAVDIKIVADASAARPDTTAVVVSKDSPLRSAADLEGKKIAVTSIGSMADLAVLAGMRAARADTSGIQWQVMKFPDMLPKLRTGEIDAAFLAEPFVSIAQAKFGVWTVFQPMVGQLEGIALNGYAALAPTTDKYPNTVAAFQRAMRTAHREAGTPEGEDAIRQALVHEANVEPGIAPVLHLPAYPLTTDPTRLQRVPDLLQEFGIITQRLDIKSMIVSS